MGKLSPTELLHRVWFECDLDDILDYGLENGHIGAESIINAAASYSNPNNELSDDEIEEIIKDADISLVMKALQDKYLTEDIVSELDTDEVLTSIPEYDVQEYFKNSSYINDTKDTAYNEGYNDAIQDLEETNQITKEQVLESFIDGTTDNKWTTLCDIFGISYYESDKLFEKINELKDNLKTSLYNNGK